MQGIGSQKIESTSYVTLVIEFSDISLEVNFLVVSETRMNVSVIIGTDVLNRESVAYIRINKQQRLTRIEKSIGASDVLHVWSSGHLSINTPLQGKERENLLSVTAEFKGNLIVEYLGRMISQGQVRPSERKEQTLVNSPVPINVK